MYTLPHQADTLPDRLSPLFSEFCRSPYDAAPEMAEKLKSITDSLQTQIRISSTLPDWKFQEGSFFGSQVISTNHRTLERIWCYCYCLNCIITELALAGPEAYLGIKDKVAFAKAFQLLKWAMQEDQADIESPWPQDLPDPASSGVYIKSSNKIFLVMSARIILHEIGHQVTWHQGQTPHEMEFYADAWADDWLLSHCPATKNHNEFSRRTLGIAFSHIPSLYFGQTVRASQTHPPSGERVLQFVKKWFPNSRPDEKDSRDAACGYLMSIMLTLLYNRGAISGKVSIPDLYVEIFESMAKEFH